MGFNIWTDCPRVPITQLLEFIVDNRGKTVPTAPSGHKLIATNCVTNNTLFPVYEKVRYLSDETYRTWFRAHPIPGDILFVNKGTPGRVCMVPDPIDFCIAQDMIALRADDSKIYNKYLFAVLRSREIQQQIYNTNVGDVIPHFKKQFMDQLLIPVPDRKVQEAIGDLYYALSYKVEHNKKINDNLQEQAATIFSDWLRSCTDSISIGELSNNILDYTPITNEMVRLLNSSDVTEGVFPKAPLVQNADLKGHFKKRFQLDDILYSEIRPRNHHYGYVLFDASEYIASTRLMVIRAITSKVSPALLYQYLLLPEVEAEFTLKTESRSGTFPQGNYADMASIIVPYASIEYQSEVSSALALIRKTIALNQIENQRLEEMRDTLLPRLMSGEVDVSSINI